MLIERTADEIIIRIPSYVDADGLQRMVDYICYKEATAKSVKTETATLKHKHRKHRIHHRIKRHKSHAAKMVGKTKLSKSVKQESY